MVLCVLHSAIEEASGKCALPGHMYCRLTRSVLCVFCVVLYRKLALPSGRVFYYQALPGHMYCRLTRSVLCVFCVVLYRALALPSGCVFYYQALPSHMYCRLTCSVLLCVFCVVLYRKHCPVAVYSTIRLYQATCTCSRLTRSVLLCVCVYSAGHSVSRVVRLQSTNTDTASHLLWGYSYHP